MRLGAAYDYFAVEDAVADEFSEEILELFIQAEGAHVLDRFIPLWELDSESW